ncbi:hypothetical protein [Geodermatophilus sp. SYSU D00700]
MRRRVRVVLVAAMAVATVGAAGPQPEQAKVDTKPLEDRVVVHASGDVVERVPPDPGGR